MTLRSDEANELAQELSERKMELKAAMFSDKLASFSTFPSIDEAFLLGELTFAQIQLPFKKLDISSPYFHKLFDIRVDYHFLLPFDHGQHIVLFEQIRKSRGLDFADR